MHKHTSTFIWGLGIVLLLACGPSADDGTGAQTDGGGGSADANGNPPTFADATPQQALCEKMDILFVIDDSGSMGEEQANLATNFPLFVDVLNGFVSSAGLPIDYHLGVTTTSVSKNWSIGGLIPDSQEGPDGALIDNECTMPRKWLERDDADVPGTFSCVAQAVGGANEEMPLEAIRLAVRDRVMDGQNAGFFRDDALLAVVVLTDENDCSRMDNNFTVGLTDDVCDDLAPVDTYISALDQVKGDRGRWATAFIAGLGPGDCSSDFGNADEATRLLSFAASAGDNAVTSSICDGDLASALGDALSTFEEACRSFPPIE